MMVGWRNMDDQCNDEREGVCRGKDLDQLRPR